MAALVVAQSSPQPLRGRAAALALAEAKAEAQEKAKAIAAYQEVPISGVATRPASVTSSVSMECLGPPPDGGQLLLDGGRGAVQLVASKFEHKPLAVHPSAVLDNASRVPAARLTDAAARKVGVNIDSDHWSSERDHGNGRQSHLRVMRRDFEHARAEHDVNFSSASASAGLLHGQFEELRSAWGSLQTPSGRIPIGSPADMAAFTATALAQNPIALGKETDTVLQELWAGLSTGNHHAHSHTATSVRSPQLTPGKLLVSGAHHGNRGGVTQLAQDFSDDKMSSPIRPNLSGLVATPDVRRILEGIRDEVAALEFRLQQDALERMDDTLPPPPPLIRRPVPHAEAGQCAVAFESLAAQFCARPLGTEDGSTGGTAVSQLEETSVTRPLPKTALGVEREVQRLQSEVASIQQMFRDELGGGTPAYHPNSEYHDETPRFVMPGPPSPAFSSRGGMSFAARTY